MSGVDALEASRRTRLTQLVWLLIVLMGLSVVVRAWTGSLPRFPWVQILALVLLLGAAWLIRQGRTQLASGLTLFSMGAALLAMMLMSDGLRDEAVVALPGVLILATLLGSQRQMLGLLALMLSVIGGLGLAHAYGWVDEQVGPSTASTAFDLMLILGASAFFMALLGSDLRGALRRLAAENAQARTARQRAEHLAAHDAVTGLGNRRSARAHFESACPVRGVPAAGDGLGLLLVDLDDFKSLNDSHGHEVGDELLRVLARRMVAAVGEGGRIYREGGDEFIVLVDGRGGPQATSRAAAALLEVTCASHRVGDIDVELGASIGVARCPEHGQDFDTLLKNADIALHEVKGSGRRAVRVFDADMDAKAKDHLMLVPRIRKAMARQEFELHFQPQLDLASGRVIGGEALLRWPTEDLGRVSPARFIPVAERSGQIVELGGWVLREACHRAAAWQAQGLGELMVSVNLSPVQLRRGTLERDVMAALDASGLQPQQLDLEVTESLLLESSHELEGAIKRLRALGVGFSIDDFGTGNSNLSYLKMFDFERLKIDQSFIRKLIGDGHNQAIVNAVLQLARALQLTVIAEGVEDEATLQHLRALGCPQGQGFHWSPALPQDDFLAFVRHRQGRHGDGSAGSLD